MHDRVTVRYRSAKATQIANGRDEVTPGYCLWCVTAVLKLDNQIARPALVLAVVLQRP